MTTNTLQRLEMLLNEERLYLFCTRNVDSVCAESTLREEINKLLEEIKSHGDNIN